MLGLNSRTDFQSQQNSSQTLKIQLIWLTIGLKYPVWNLQHLLLVGRESQRILSQAGNLLK
jgi:hypothetical protein